ncbi:MAG: alpha/beta hydrolase [Gemmatimonadaceae bacterium]
MAEVVELNGLTMTVERPPLPPPPPPPRPHASTTSPAMDSRPPILLLHGLLGGAWYFDWYQKWFAARGYPSVALNLRGHCGSRPVPDIGRVSIHDYISDAREAAAALARPPAASRPVVIGHSMGGLIAQKLAEENLVRAAVLLCAAPPRGISVASPLLVRKQLRHIFRLLFSRPLRGSLDDHAALTFNRVPRAEWEELYARLSPDSGRAGRQISLGAVMVDPERVRCPMLVIAGGDDHFVVPRVGRALAERYGAPYIEFPEHGHFIVREPGWEEPAEEIARWLEGVTELTDNENQSSLLSPGGAT